MRLVPVQCLLAAGLAVASAFAVATPQFDLEYAPMKGEYALYGGALSDPVAPSASSKKIAFVIEGKAAQDMFNAMGPDIRDECLSEKGARARKKDGEKLACFFRPKEGYRCSIGFDLRTGTSIAGSYC